MAISLETIASRVENFIRAEAHIPANDPQFNRETDLFDGGYLDSIRLIGLLAFVESSFGVKVDQAELFGPQFSTVQGIARVLHEAATPTPAAAPCAPPAPPASHPSVRACRREDLPAVARLYEHVMRSGSREAPAGLVHYFERQFFDHPHAEQDLPSLVFEEDGKVLGFLGAHTRRFRFRGAPVRLACAGQFIVEPEARCRAVGTHLMRQFLGGRQEISITDGGTPEVQRMWEGLGGHARTISCVRWTRILRPWHFSAQLLARQLGLPGGIARLGALLRPVWAVADGVTRLAGGSRFAPRRRGRLKAEPLTAAVFAAELAKLSEHVALVPSYDAAYLGWLFRELGAVRSRGEIRRVLLRGPEGETEGWYLYYRVRGGISQVLQVHARRGRMDDVLEHLFADADTQGSTAVQGRMEPELFDALSRLHGTMQVAWVSALAHSSDPRLGAALFEGDALLTRLEGEWWSGFQLEPLDHAAPVGGAEGAAAPHRVDAARGSG